MKPADRHPHIGQTGARRRGSTLIVMLGILAFMTLLFTTLSMTGRLEIMAARKFADGYRDNGVAVAGIQAALATLEQRSGAVALNQPWARPEGQMALARTDSAERSGAPSFFWGVRASTSAASGPDPDDNETESSAPSQRVEIYDPAEVYGQLGADITVQDESGKINLNAVGALRPYGTAPWQPRAAQPDAGQRSRPGGARFMPSPGTGAAAVAQPGGVAQPNPNGAGEGGARMAGAAGADGEVLRGPADLDLAQALHRILESQGVTGVNAAELAHRIIQYRNGPDGRPDVVSLGDTRRRQMAGGVTAVGRVDQATGMAPASLAASQPVDDPYAHVSDPRRPVRGDDRPFHRVEDLMRVPGMTLQIFEALRDHVTVFSASADVATLSDQAMMALAGALPTERIETPKTPLNSASLEEIQETLRLHFPNWNALLIRQFAANIVDARDEDHIPTMLEGENGLPILGIELTPYINEVWPDSVTSAEDGDDGQFLELYNPYDVTIDLTGWIIDTGVGRTTLHGAIRPGGFLIVTDDFNGTRDAGQDRNRPGYGSFYDIFGLMPNGTTRLLVEDPFFDLPNDAGVVWLYDADGNPIDYFPYSGGRFDGVERSFQRDDPRVRASRLMRPTPFERNSAYEPPQEMAEEALFPSARQFNQPFASVGDILHIHAGRAGAMTIAGEAPVGGSVNVQTGTFRRALPTQYTEWSVAWAWPQVQSLDGSEPDLRLLDVFCLDLPLELQMLEAQSQGALPGQLAPSPSAGQELPAPGAPIPNRQIGLAAPAAQWQPAPSATFPGRQPGLGAGGQVSGQPIPLNRSVMGGAGIGTLSGPSPVSADIPAGVAPDDRTPEAVARRQALDTARLERNELLRLGRLNINTAPAEVLAAVAMIFPDGSTFADRVVARRSHLQSQLEAARNWQGAPYPTLSAFFMDDGLFGDLDTQQRIEAARRLCGALTVDSRSFRIISRSRSDEQTPSRRLFTRSAEALVCLTQVGPRLVSWRYLYGDGRKYEIQP